MQSKGIELDKVYPAEFSKSKASSKHNSIPTIKHIIVVLLGVPLFGLIALEKTCLDTRPFV